MIKKHLERVKEAYMRYENRLSSFGLVAGFLFDIYVLKRIDMPAENMWIVVHILIAIFGIVALTFYEEKEGRKRDPGDLYYWVLVTVQFAFGGLLSTFLVFYFRSSSIAVSWPFLFILVIAFLANEFARDRYSRITFQIYYLFLSIFCFLIYYLPIIMGVFGSDVFFLSGLVSLLITLVFILLLSQLAKKEYENNKGGLFFGIAFIYIVFNILYYTNIIPPIPLSLKDAGVYYSIKKVSDGSYDVLSEKRVWSDILRRYDLISTKEGEAVYVFSSVFSPTNINTDIVHRWKYFDEEKGDWIQTNKIVLPIFGGREEGYRTYSLSKNIFPAKWMVSVETNTLQVLGVIKFHVLENVERNMVLIKK